MEMTLRIIIYMFILINDCFILSLPTNMMMVCLKGLQGQNIW